MSFPVVGTLMIEPTESESKRELDKFIEAMISIKAEIEHVENGKVSPTDNLLKNSPHPVDVLLKSKWEHPYTREDAAYPVKYLRQKKFWPTVSRIDDTYGDRNLVFVVNFDYLLLYYL
jgi:glycine dehydrogenase